MKSSLFLAARYLAHHRWRSATLIACVTVLATLPLALEVLRAAGQRQLLARAVDTPLVAGERAGGIDLVMNSLYFTGDPPEFVSMDLVERIEDSVLAQAIPLYVRFQARGFPVVGTSLDYFEFRELRIADGRAFAMLGECVIGAEAARSLSLRPGDSVVSSPETVFDLAGVYPLKMKVAGILEESGSPDDRALFVDVKTTWVMQGLVHGHQDLATLNDPTMVVKREDGAVTATAKLYHYNEITKENVDSFHVHGDPATYPLTAVLARPHDDKSAALLRGRYVDASTGYRIAVPTDTVSELLERIFRIKRLLQGGMAVVAGATLLALVLVFSLSLRLRQRELHTLFKLGAARGTVFRLVASEIAIITLLSACLSAVLLQGVAANSDILVRTLVLS